MMELHDDCLLAGAQFNNALWRSILNETLIETDDDIESLKVISPWGFELSQNKNFLQKKIKRFYCYLFSRTDNQSSTDEILKKFTSTLLKKLAHLDSDFYNQLACIVHATDDQLSILYNKKPTNYECKETDKLICLDHRKTNTAPIIDYAHYIMCIPQVIAEEKGEISSWKNNRMARHRLFQLYIMMGFVFNDYLKIKQTKDDEFFNKIIHLIDNSFQEIYTAQPEKQKANQMELDAVYNKIIPIAKMILNILNDYSKNEAIAISCQAYHSSEILYQRINKDLYDYIIRFTSSTYREFI